MEENFDSPTYSGQELEFEEEGPAAMVKKGLSLIKANLKTIIVILVLLAVAFFAYDYFIGSMRDVTITLEDTEGTALGSSRLTLFDSTGNEVFFGQRLDTYSMQLRVGKYRYEARDPDYKTRTSELTIGTENSPTIVLEKDVGVEIVNFESEFPSSLIAGETRTIEFQVKNTESTPKDIAYVVFGGSLKDWGIAEKEVRGIQANASKTVVLQFTVPRDLKIDEDEEIEFKATARIKFTNDEHEKTFGVFASPEVNLDISGFDTGVDAGETVPDAEVEIENGSDFPIENLEAKIVITSAQKNGGASKVIQWFSFSKEPGESGNPWEKTIDLIEENRKLDTATLNVRIDVPLTAKKENITGEVVVSAAFLPQPLRQTFNFEIESEASYGIELDAPEEIGVDYLFGPEFEYYETITEEIDIDNVGESALTNIRISVNNPVVCTTQWLTLREPTEISLLEAGDSTTITIRVSAPLGKGDGEQMECKLKYRFDNPLAGQAGQDDYISGTPPGWILITTSRQE